MKKLIITLLCVTLFIGSFAQKPFVIFGHVPKGLFTGETADRSVRATGDFLWSLDAVVSGAEITLNGNTFETSFLSGVGAAVGYKHYKPLPDGSAVSNWGISGAMLTKVKVNETIRTGVEVAVLANLYNFTAGPVYLFNERKLGLLVGANISF